MEKCDKLPRPANRMKNSWNIEFYIYVVGVVFLINFKVINRNSYITKVSIIDLVLQDNNKYVNLKLCVNKVENVHTRFIYAER